VSDDQEEPQRVFGIPVGTSRPGVVEDEEQRVLGMPVRWLEPIGQDTRRVLTRLAGACRSWRRREPS
jgi:hypothetical protein